MDKDSCDYLLHPRRYNSDCHPRTHPVPRFLHVGASGTSDAARAPRSALCLRAVLADTPADSFHHALQPPLQPRGEKEKEVVGCTPPWPGLDSDPALPQSSGQTSASWRWLQPLFPQHLAPTRRTRVGLRSPLSFSQGRLWQRSPT